MMVWNAPVVTGKLDEVVTPVMVKDGSRVPARTGLLGRTSAASQMGAEGDRSAKGDLGDKSVLGAGEGALQRR